MKNAGPQAGSDACYATLVEGEIPRMGEEAERLIRLQPLSHYRQPRFTVLPRRAPDAAVVAQEENE